MVDLDQRPTLGPYALMRPLPPCRHGERWLVLHAAEQTSHVIYRLQPCRGKSERRRMLAVLEGMTRFEHAHALRIELFSFDMSGQPWIVTPYTGDVDGLLHLDRLLREKGGQMDAGEAERALTQLLELSAAAHAQGHWHGPIAIEEVLVDRHGSVTVELYGLARRMAGVAEIDAESVRDEVRSIIEIGYQLVTGLRAEEPLIPAGRLVKRLDRQWDVWLDMGLNPSGGFDTAAEALAALPSRKGQADQRRPTVTVRAVLGKFRQTTR